MLFRLTCHVIVTKENNHPDMHWLEAKSQMSLKGLLDNAVYIGIVIFVVGALTLAIDKMQSSITAKDASGGNFSYAYNVLGNGSSAIGSLITSYGTLLVTMIAIGVLLRLILGSFDFGGGGDARM